MFLFGKIWYRLLIAGIRFVSVLHLFSWRHYLWTKTLLWQAENNYFKLSCGFKQLMVKSKALNSWWSNLRLFDRLVSTYMYFRESWLYSQNLDYQDFSIIRYCFFGPIFCGYCPLKEAKPHTMSRWADLTVTIEFQSWPNFELANVQVLRSEQAAEYDTWVIPEWRNILKRGMPFCKKRKTKKWICNKIGKLFIINRRN